MEKTRLAARAYIKRTNNDILDGFEVEVNDEIVTLPALQRELSSPDTQDLSVVRTIFLRFLIQKITNTRTGERGFTGSPECSKEMEFQRTSWCGGQRGSTDDLCLAGANIFAIVGVCSSSRS